LITLLEPIDLLRSLEANGDHAQRLALLEEIKSLPFGAVWDYYCLQNSVPGGMQFMTEMRTYEQKIQAER
jgi:L-rhamnose isomerase